MPLAQQFYFKSLIAMFNMLVTGFSSSLAHQSSSTGEIIVFERDPDFSSSSLSQIKSRSLLPSAEHCFFIKFLELSNLKPRLLRGIENRDSAVSKTDNARDAFTRMFFSFHNRNPQLGNALNSQRRLLLY